ncbi:MAG: hypothetical protein KBC91_06885 [Candidatus Omnitrophica bacterium]|nr:hypothetical protein [Candidatus Omnitrophota bacterium]
MTLSITIRFCGLLGLLALSAAQTAQAGQCRDPWVTQAIQQVTGRAPTGNHESGDCNIYNFNNGKWGSYPELVGYVQNYVRANSRIPAASALANSTNRPSLAGGNRLNNPSAIVAGGGGNFNNRNNLIGDGGGT